MLGNAAGALGRQHLTQTVPYRWRVLGMHQVDERPAQHILVGQADTTVLVARAGRTPIGAMRAAAAQTEGAGGNVLGIALNYVLPRWQTYADALYFDESKSYYSVS